MRYGRYETLQPIASGGMATVYLGRAIGSSGFERRVAVKVMHPHVSTDPEFITMFLDEARLAARIHHPNVVSTLDFQRLEEATFLVMEYIDGASLRDILRALRKRRQRMPIGTAVRIMIDALSGLHAAHELRSDDGEALSVVHRDVSPHNILVGADGITRITDFGVARAAARLTSTRGVRLKGKIAYMAPEQLSHNVDRRADVYSAGVVLWESLTGRRLFKAEHEGALIAQILEGARRTPRELVPVIPDRIDEACMIALALDPNLRFPTAAAFADALEHAAQSSDVRVPSLRQLAAFVHQYKVPLTPSAPASTDDPMPDSEHTSPDSESAPLSASQPSTMSEASSVLSGIGTVRSQSAPMPRRRSRLRSLAALLGGFLLVGLGGATALVTTGKLQLPWRLTSAPPPEPASEPPVAESAVDEEAPELPSATPSEVPSEVPSALEGAPSVSAPVPQAVAPPAGNVLKPQVKPPPAKTPAPKTPKKGPLGFEPNDL